MTPTVILALLLALSVAGNAFLGNAYLGQRDRAVTGEVKTDQVTVVAQECSKGVDELVVRADERKKANAANADKAKRQAVGLRERADAILAAPASSPADACKSAQSRVDDWWGAKP